MSHILVWVRVRLYNRMENDWKSMSSPRKDSLTNVCVPVPVPMPVGGGGSPSLTLGKVGSLEINS